MAKSVVRCASAASRFENCRSSQRQAEPVNPATVTIVIMLTFWPSNRLPVALDSTEVADTISGPRHLIKVVAFSFQS